MMGSIAAWAPRLSVSGCVAAFDMTDSSSYTVTGGATVTSITNTVSGTAWTEGTNPPAYQATGLNGLPCMKGDGTNDRIISTEAAVLNVFAGEDRAFTVFAAFDPVTPDKDAAIFGAGSTSHASNRSYSIGTATTGNGRLSLGRRDDGGISGTVSSSVDVAAVPHVVAWVSAGTTSSIYDGIGAANPNGGASNVGTITPTRCALLAWPVSTPLAFSPAKLGALLIFDSALATSDRIRIQSRLLSRHGIS